MKKNEIYQSIRNLVRPRSNFDLSRTNKMSIRMGNLYPCLVEPSIPGDTFSLGQNSLCRFAPMTAPLMHNIDMKTFYFNVPMRLLYKDWEDFITGGVDGVDAPLFPTLVFTAGTTVNGFFFESLFANGTLADYLGFPTLPAYEIQGQQSYFDSDLIEIEKDYKIDLTPFIAYNLIYSEYFRDQNVEEEFDPYFIADYGNIIKAEDISFDSDYTPDLNSPVSVWVHQLLQIKRKCWEKNYFTSALPEPQRGEAVPLPLDLDVSVYYKPSSDPSRQNNAGWVTGDGEGINQSKVDQLFVDGQPNGRPAQTFLSELEDVVEYDPADSLEGRVRNVHTDVTELRRAIKLQEFLEAMARGGSRYIEQMKTMFGVSSSDARLQRPEFLGSVKQPVIISEVLQTSGSNKTEIESGDNTPQGNMSGRAVSAGSSYVFNKFHEEHSLVIGLVVVMPHFDIYNGMPRKYQKFDRFDYYWQQFDHIGEQAILNEEVHFTPLGLQADKSEFGYSPRYAEYKSSLNEVHGEFKDSLDFWHLGFEVKTPYLNASFLKPSDQLLDRAFAVNSVEQVYLEMYFNFTAKRMMSRYSTPKID